VPEGVSRRALNRAGLKEACALDSRIGRSLEDGSQIAVHQDSDALPALLPHSSTEGLSSVLPFLTMEESQCRKHIHPLYNQMLATPTSIITADKGWQNLQL